MDPQKTFALLLLASLAGGPPVGAAEGIGAPRIISNELMDLLEDWSDPTASVETVALDSRPELIEDYLPFVEHVSGGAPLADVLAERLPLAWAELKSVFYESAEGEPAAADLLAYVMAGGGEEYAAWQRQLAESGADFRTFVAEAYPEVIDEVEQLDASPAKRGVGLLEFAAERGVGGAIEELQLESYEPYYHFKDCACWTVASFTDQAGPGWTTTVNQNYSSKWGKLPTKRRQLEYSVAARGAARDVQFHRRSEHNDYTESRDETGNSSAMRVRMSCTVTDSSYAICPRANACRGELLVRLGYASRVYENHDVGGAWSKEALALAADYAAITYQAPAAAPVVEMEKGVAVGGSFVSATPLDNVVGQFWNGRVGATRVMEQDSFTLGQQLLDPSHNDIGGLIINNDKQGSYDHAMRMVWQSGPLVLWPEQTHLFKIDAASRVYGRGYGGQSDSRATVDSAAFLAGVGRKYSCLPTVFMPAEQAYWNYGRSTDAPYQLWDLQHLIQELADWHLGIVLPNLASAVPGHYP